MDGDEDEIPSDIASEFQRMSDDADAILQSIRNDEAQQKQKQQKRHGQQQPAPGAPVTGPKRRTSASGVRAPTVGGQLFGDTYYDEEDDDMTDELHHLDSVPIDLQRELSALDGDRVSELLLHGGHGLDDAEDFEDEDDGGGSTPTGRGCGASATAPPKNFQFRSNPKTPLIQNQPARALGQSSVPDNRASFPYDSAVAELRALTEAVEDDDVGRGGAATAMKPLPSGGRVLKPIPPGPLESVPLVLVVAFAVVWAVAAVVLRHAASPGFLDDQGTIRLPTIWR